MIRILADGPLATQKRTELFWGPDYLPLARSATYRGSRPSERQVAILYTEYSGQSCDLGHTYQVFIQIWMESLEAGLLVSETLFYAEFVGLVAKIVAMKTWRKQEFDTTYIRVLSFPLRRNFDLVKIGLRPKLQPDSLLRLGGGIACHDIRIAPSTEHEFWRQPLFG
jgi:hypothetical protein